MQLKNHSGESNIASLSFYFPTTLLNHSFRRLNQEGIRLVDMREVVNAIFYLLLSWLFMGDAAP